MTDFTQDFFTSRNNRADGDTRIGQKGRIWYDSISNTIRISDGVTPGGIVVSGGGGSGNYTLPTATTTIKGGVKIDGTSIAIDANGVISIGSVAYSNITGAPSVPTKVSDLTNDTGFITGVTWNQVTGKPTLFSGAYADLTGKPTAVSAFTNDSGYLTSSALSSYATQAYVTSRGYITSSAVPTSVSQLTNDIGFLTTSSFDLDTIDFDNSGKLHVTGILPGDAGGFQAIFAGRAAGIAALPNTVIQSQAQVNDYAQNNFQNTYDGNHASTEWVATSPNGDDSNYYIDLGINGASWDGTAVNSLYTNVGQRDGWLYVQGGNAGGGNLVLGTSLANTYVKIIAGNASAGNTEVARFSSSEVKLSKQLRFNDNTIQTTAWPGSLSYNSLTDLPTLFSGSYTDLTNKPSLFSGAYADLTGKPTLFSGSYTDLTNKPSLFSGAYADLTGKPTLFSGNYNDLTNKPVTVSALDDLSDVDLSTPPTVGQVLKYDGTKWAPGTDIAAGGVGLDADTLDGFDSTYFLNYNNLANKPVLATVSTSGSYTDLTNKPTIPTTVTINGTTITLGSTGTITATATNALVIGTGLVGTTSTYNGSSANTIALDLSTTAITAVGGTTSTLTASTITRNYVITGGTLVGTYVIRLPDLTTLTNGQQFTFYTTAALVSWQLSNGTVITTNSNSGSVSRIITFTVLSNTANSTANISFSVTASGFPVGIGSSLVTNNSPFISSLGSNSVDNSNSTLLIGPTTTSTTIGATTGAYNQTINVGTSAAGAAYTKTLNLGTSLAGGTNIINIGTGAASGVSALNIGSSITTSTFRGTATFVDSLIANNPISGSITGNAATATKLGTARAINGQNFDGSAAITITAVNPNALTIGSGLSGSSYDGSTPITIAIDSTVALRADVHYIGTTAIALNRTSTNQTLTGVSIDGNAGSVTNGVYTSTSYANPSWITSLAYSKLTGTPSLFSGSYTDLTNKPTIYSSAFIGTTNLDFTRTATNQTLTGVNIDGNAGSVTNGLYSSGSYANPSWITSLAYSKLTGAPTVPVNISQLTNDTGYTTSTDVAILIANSLTNYITSSTIRTVIANSLTNYTTTATVNTLIANSLTNYATQSYVTAQGYTTTASVNTLIANSLTNYSTTNGVNTLIANSLTNYATQSYVTTRGYITSSSISVNTAASSNSLSSLTYNTNTGILTFTPFSLNTATLMTTAVSATTLSTARNINGVAFNGSSNINVNTLTNGSYSFTINSDGTVTYPNGMLNTGANQNLLWSTSTSGSGLTYRAASGGAGLPFQGNAATNNSGFVITQINGTPGTGLISNSWTFDWNGKLTFPDSTQQTTAWNTSTNVYYNQLVNAPSTTGTAVFNVISATNITIGGLTQIIAFTNTNAVTSLTAGTGTAVSTATGSVTVWINTATLMNTAVQVANSHTAGTGLSGSTFNGSSAVTWTLNTATLMANAVSVTGAAQSAITSVGTLTSLTSNGTITINSAGSVFGGTGAQLFINGSTYSRIDFSEVYANPVVNDRSTGTRLLFYSGARAGGMDCAIGMSSSTLWSSVLDPTFNFGWYAGDGLGHSGSGAPVTLLTLSGSGVLTVPGGAATSNNTATNKTLNIGTRGQLFDDGNFHIHANNGTLWLNSLDSSNIKIGTQYNTGSGSDVDIGKNLIVNNGSVTANATAAFIAGSNAVSNVSLQMPSESAIRNLTNGSTNMYFDVSIGGSTQGQFQFRSSNGYSNVLTMSTTGITFNTGATFTARTPALARTSFNAAIDTELTVNDLRFRISNQGGIFPQVISNTGGTKNLAWTGVGALNGTAIAQAGSTGSIVANNAWTTLYNLHGMDAAGDTITVTLQDKAAGIIYRITFMRSDNGTTTGYNIIGERIL